MAQVSARLGDDVGYLIGSALPDIATMGRFRLTERPDSDSVGAGIDLHHRTDDAFHGHRWFRRNSQAVTKTLEQAGLPRGAAMACGHVGIELLLDGQLLDQNPDLRPSVQAAMVDVGRAEHGLTEVVASERQQDWAVHLERIADWTLPDDYRQPDSVAERLRRILARRRRLAFPIEQVGLVADTLRQRQPILEAGSKELIEDLRSELATPS
ncbi:MAG: hypothetical protein ACRBK7_19390 [Acidimicrobiales bacterium]